MDRRLGVMAAAAMALALAAPSASSAATVIDFELNVSGNFLTTSPLTTQYAGLTFTGWQTGHGGHVLNQSTNFGVPALSGVDFLAFNPAVTDTIEIVSFAAPVTNVSVNIGSNVARRVGLIGATSPFDPWFPQWDAQAFSANAAGQYVKLTILGTFKYIAFGLEQCGSGCTPGPFVVDDLSWGFPDPVVTPPDPPPPPPTDSVPEPGTWALLIGGVALLAARLRARSPRRA